MLDFETSFNCHHYKELDSEQVFWATSLGQISRNEIPGSNSKDVFKALGWVETNGLFKEAVPFIFATTSRLAFSTQNFAK